MLNELHNTIKDQFVWRNARVDCLIQIIFALFQTRTVNLVLIADYMNGSVQKLSNYRRLQRFFDGANFCTDTLAKLLLSFFAHRSN